MSKSNTKNGKGSPAKGGQAQNGSFIIKTRPEKTGRKIKK